MNEKQEKTNIPGSQRVRERFIRESKALQKNLAKRKKQQAEREKLKAAEAEQSKD